VAIGIDEDGDLDAPLVYFWILLLLFITVVVARFLTGSTFVPALGLVV
jgi:positive regulator of sigma E activity